MLGAPGPHPLDIRRATEVVAIGRLKQPTPLTGRFTRPPAVRLAAVALVVRIARIRMEQFTAVQTLASSSLFHLGQPSELHQASTTTALLTAAARRRRRRKTRPKTEEEDEKIGGGRTRRRNFSAGSLRPDDYSFSAALTPPHNYRLWRIGSERLTA
jgi:hypothetical protein